MTLLSEANPVPDVESSGSPRTDAAVYLAGLNLRSSEMIETDERQTATANRWRRPAGAFALAAAVVAVIGTVSWFAIYRNDANVATRVVVTEAFAQAVSAGETDLSSLVTPDATFGPETVPLDHNLAEFWAGLHTTITLSDCEENAQVVTCDYEWTDAIRRAQDRPEYGILTFLVKGERVASIARDWDSAASGWSEQGDPVIDYLAWLNANHPDWDSGLQWVGEPGPIGGGYAPLGHDDPVHDARYAQDLTRYLDEYQAHLQADGGLPG